MMAPQSVPVIPAKAGIQLCRAASVVAWIPAFAGMKARASCRGAAA